MGKVSVVGAGMKSHPGVAAKVFSTLGDAGHQHRDDLHVADQDLLRRPRRPVDRAVRALHEAFELGADEVEAEHPFGRSPSHEPVPRRRRRRHRRRRHRHAAPSCASAASRPRDRPVRLRALRRQGARRRRHRPAARATRRSRASTSRSSPPAATTSREWAPRFVEAGAVVVDNSSAFRRDPESPARRLRGQPGGARRATAGLIANPNCSTMQLMVALKPIHDAAGIERLIVSTYQSVSGTGVKARRGARGRRRTRVLRRRGARRPQVYPHHDRVQRPRRRRQLPRRRRPHRRGAQDDVRDAQDPRRRDDRDRRHLRARARCAARTRSR